MSNPRKPLSNHVPWSGVATELDIHIRTVGLPVATQCPFCQSVMRVFRDRLLEGEWFFCTSCRRQGDMIELAAEVWELAVPETISRLKRLGFELPHSADDVRAYLQQHVKYRQRIHGLWQNALSLVANSNTLLRLTHHLRLACEVSEGRCDDGPAAILRGNNTVAIERCFAPGAMKHADARPQRNNPSERALFRGPGWDEVLMIPFYDLPWRVCAFTFVGRRADPEHDFVFKRANMGSYRPFGMESGLAMHPKVLEESERWDDTIIATGDLITAWRLQMRHLEQNLRPLPLVAWHDSRDYPSWHAGGHLVRTRNAWEMLGNRDIVFWMPRATLATFEQAIRTGGKISTVGPREPDEHSSKEYCWKYTPEDLARHVQDHARPWPEVFSDYIDTLSGPAVEDMLALLEVDGENVDEIVEQLRSSTHLRIARVRATADVPKSIEFDGRTIVEKDNKWFVVNHKKQLALIMDGVFRIDALIFVEERQETYYAGRVLYQNEVVEFYANRETVEKNTCDWIDRLLLKNITQSLLYLPPWCRHVVRIARQFQNPEVIQGVDRVGYDVKRSRFVFPKFTIENGGKVTELAYSVFPNPVPCNDLEEPDAISPEELSRPSRLCGEGGTEVFWGLTACVIGNALSPVFNRRSNGIVLEGHMAGQIGQATARAFGCVEYWPRALAYVKEALQAEQDHGWPILLEVPLVLQRKYRRQLLQPGDDRSRNCIVSTDFIAAKLLSIDGGWHTISTEQKGGISADTLAVAKMLIPAYLKDLSERRFDLGEYPATSSDLVNLIVLDLARFVSDRYGNEEDVLSARRAMVLDSPTTRTESFLDLLIHFVESRLLEIRPTATSRRRPALVELEHDGENGLQISFKVLEKLIAQSSAPVPSPDQLYRVLEESDILLDEDEGGLVFRRECFEARYRMLRVNRSGRLKIHV